MYLIISFHVLVIVINNIAKMYNSSVSPYAISARGVSDFVKIGRLKVG